MLNLKIVEADLDDNFKIDVNSVEENISDKTVAIVGIAGTTELGVIDPIDKLSDIAFENNIYLHVDAAFGGFSIPFLKRLGYEFPDFDFSLPGVCSMTVDPHKMGLAPIPAGGIIFRKEEYHEHLVYTHCSIRAQHHCPEHAYEQVPQIFQSPYRKRHERGGSSNEDA